MNSESLISLQGIVKTFGTTQAVQGVTLELAQGEALGIVGHNGAGKTTLIRVAAGITAPTGGVVGLGGREMPSRFSVDDARDAGLRYVSQEILLCPMLRLFENTLVAHRYFDHLGRPRRSSAKEAFSHHLANMFPGQRLSSSARTGRLSLGELQMAQLAIGTLPVGSRIRCIVLDEPTSALSPNLARDLFRYLATLRAESGVGVVIVSHKMEDIIANTDRVVVMRDGVVVAEMASGNIQPADLLEAMGGVQEEVVAVDRHASERQNARSEGQGTAVRVRGPAIELKRGEVVGIAGLEGQGQVRVLEEIWRAARRRGREIGRRVVRGWSASRDCRAAYISGNRQEFGIFPLWGVARNISISSIRAVERLGFISFLRERQLVDAWVEQLEIIGSQSGTVMELSGGNQQKVVLARGLARQPSLLVLDDPFRGVDVMTKRSCYARLRAEADRGMTIVWYSTENAEFSYCDRVYVLRAGEVNGVLDGDAISEEAIVRLSFVTGGGGLNGSTTQAVA